MNLNSATNTVTRWLRFNAVGALGVFVQLATLTLLWSGLQMNYLAATVLAVEAAVIHNFAWHERFTWADRVQMRWRESLRRFLKFNATTGALSIAGNAAAMKVLVGTIHLNYLVANFSAIAACSLLNFVVSDRVVFEAEVR